MDSSASLSMTYDYMALIRRLTELQGQIVSCCRVKTLHYAFYHKFSVI